MHGRSLLFGLTGCWCVWMVLYLYCESPGGLPPCFWEQEPVVLAVRGAVRGEHFSGAGVIGCLRCFFSGTRVGIVLR